MRNIPHINPVATVLTVYGIETVKEELINSKSDKSVATVLTVYGIETTITIIICLIIDGDVATVLTVYGIETLTLSIFGYFSSYRCNSPYRLRY